MNVNKFGQFVNASYFPKLVYIYLILTKTETKLVHKNDARYVMLQDDRGKVFHFNAK